MNLIEQSKASKVALVIDENIRAVAKFLKEKGRLVILPQQGLDDQHIQSMILPGRAIVTNNTKDFINSAKEFDYDVIDVNGVFIGTDEESLKMAASAIDRAISQSRFGSLTSSGGNYILYVKDSGKFKIEEI